MVPHILVIDDDPAVCRTLRTGLEEKGYKIFEAPALKPARELLDSQRINAVILDLHLPDGNGIEWIEEAKNERPYTPILVITGFGDVPTAVEAMRRGADHFTTKPISVRDLQVMLEKCLELDGLRRVSRFQKQKAATVFFGSTPKWIQLKEDLETAAQSDSALLILGETGSGKGVIAEWIHRNSVRRSSPFVEVNCAALGGDLLLSELYGHSKGAFTGATDQKPGLLEAADGGTLFLDEIGDMDKAVQAKLLKSIETKRYRRLGEVHERHSDFRLIGATNKNLETEVAKGDFRRDLFYRISVFTVHIPSLRESIVDLSKLSEEILRSLSVDVTISWDAMQQMQNYDWPGNVRELRNVLERGAILAKEGIIEPKHLPFQNLSQPKVSNDEAVEEQVRKMELAHIEEVIGQCGGNVSKAAKLLGLSRTTLYRRLQELKNENQL